MSFLYPRVISVTRAAQHTAAGYQGYSGETIPTETPVLADIPAAIQLKKNAGRSPANLPQDVSRVTYWEILIPAQAAVLGDILDRDYILDDAGIRYQVTGAYWTLLGYQLLTERLET